MFEIIIDALVQFLTEENSRLISNSEPWSQPIANKLLHDFCG